MKAGWKTVKLGEACKIVNGATPSTSVEANWGGPHCWITPAEMGGLSDPYVGETRRTLTDAGLADCSASLLPAGSVILSSRAPIGHVIINTVPMATNQGCKSMIPRGDLDAKFLFYFIKANVPLLESLGTGATFKELSGGKLASVEIPLPPLSEQKRIVALLDEAFAGIDEAKAKAEANLENAGLLLKSYLNSTFSQAAAGWQEKTLGETCEMYQPKTIGMKDLVPDGPYSVFGANGIIGKYDKYNHEEPQLLITCRGATCGAVNISEPNSWITGNAMVVRPKDGEIDLQFLEYFFRGGVDISVAITGTAQPQITRTNLAPLIVRFPKSVSEQKNHVKAFKSLTDETCALANIYRQKLEMVNELKSSLLSQAFAGELTS